MNKELYYSFQILKSVYFNNAYSSIELNKLINQKQNEKINFALITKIVYGVLEKDIYLEYVVKNFVSKLPDKNILLLLKMATYTNKFTNGIPNYAVINECVNLSKKENKNISGFVNATLKNIFNKSVIMPNKESNFIDYLSITYSYPKWIIIELLKHKSKQFVEDYLKQNLTTLTHIRIKNTNFNQSSGFTTEYEITNEYKQLITQFISDLNKFDIKFEKSPLQFCLYVDYNKLLKHNEFKNRYVVQGLTSIVASLNMDVQNVKNVLDCTGAPGGKSAFMAEVNNKANIICCDIHKHRVDLIKKFMDANNIKNVKPFMQDATKFNEMFLNKFDRILCDVPCSGIGVVNKKPDILLNKTLSDVKTLSGVQFNILNNNAKYLKKQGVLIYSTCSIMIDENERVVEKFLKANPNFICEQVNTFNINVNNQENMITFYPNLSNTEGFFITKLKRIN